MDRRSFVVRSLMLAGVAGGAIPARARDGFVSLINGTDLTGWHVHNGKMECWKLLTEETVLPPKKRSFLDRILGRKFSPRKVKEVMISCVEPGGGWLTSDKEYADFILRLEYRIPAGGNSGVGIRYPSVGDPAHVGMEIQILDDDSPQYRNLKAAQYNGGIYYQSPPKSRAARPPGEWNSYEVRCQGPRIEVRLNGVVIQDVNVEEFKTGEGGYKPLAERPRRGFIGMQSHGHRVDFRNVEIKEL